MGASAPAAAGWPAQAAARPSRTRRRPIPCKGSRPARGLPARGLTAEAGQPRPASRGLPVEACQAVRQAGRPDGQAARRPRSLGGPGGRLGAGRGAGRPARRAQGRPSGLGLEPKGGARALSSPLCRQLVQPVLSNRSLLPTSCKQARPIH